jgi:hypothetical protein
VKYLRKDMAERDAAARDYITRCTGSPFCPRARARRLVAANFAFFEIID